MNCCLHSSRVAVVAAFLMATASVAAPETTRPFSGRGPEANTLVAYTATRAAYSLSDSLEFLQLQLRRVATRLEALPVAQVSVARIAAADYVVVFCPQPAPALPAEFLRGIAEAQRPVLWVGCSLSQLEALAPISGQFDTGNLPWRHPLTAVKHAAGDWNAPVSLAANTALLAGLSRPNLRQEEGGECPRVWRTGRVTCFAAVPAPGPVSEMFSDLLLDFYEAQDVPPARVFLRIDDYECRSDHRQMQRVADYLHARDIPFILGVIPAWRDPASGRELDLNDCPEFVSTLRYAQQRGGRLVLSGWAHEPGTSEFWDVREDRPVSLTPAQMRAQLLAGVRLMLRHGLLPLAWETPAYAASAPAYAEIGRVFSTSVERVQLSDATHRDLGTTPSFTVDRAGRFIVPENLGYVQMGGKPLAQIKAGAERLTKLRGTVVGAYAHAYQPFHKITALADLLAGLQVPFLDLADLDLWVQTPETILLAGRAERRVMLRHATVRWKAFDRAGNLRAIEVEKAPSTGERTFKRIGVGDYEVIELTEAQP
jgi:uncharacterized protein YdaL